MIKRDKVAIYITLIAFVFFIPGIYLPMISLDTVGNVETPITMTEIQAPTYSSSILQTVQTLFTHNNRLIATLIFLFSIVIPVVKGLLLIYALKFSEIDLRRKILSFLKSISKWSMSDVFIVAIFLAYYSTRAETGQSGKETTILGIPLNIEINLIAELQLGFYCFLTYCLLALVALQIYED